MLVLSQALIAGVHESAIGPYTTSLVALHTSASGGKADKPHRASGDCDDREKRNIVISVTARLRDPR